VIALGDGTEESHTRMQGALDRPWTYADEAFQANATLAAARIAPGPETLRAPVTARN